MEIEIANVVIDCADPSALSEFWETVTGYEVEEDEDDWVLLVDPDDEASIQLGFQQVPESKTVKNRVHLDLYADDVDAVVRWLETLGASELWVSDEDSEEYFVTLADPEGNEFCVVQATADGDELDEDDELEDDELEDDELEDDELEDDEEDV